MLTFPTDSLQVEAISLWRFITEKETSPHILPPAQLSNTTYFSEQAEKRRPFSWQKGFFTATLPEDKIISGQTAAT